MNTVNYVLLITLGRMISLQLWRLLHGCDAVFPLNSPSLVFIRGKKCVKLLIYYRRQVDPVKEQFQRDKPCGVVYDYIQTTMKDQGLLPDQPLRHDHWVNQCRYEV